MLFFTANKNIELLNFTPEGAELFDIAHKFQFRKKKLKEWYLKPVYGLAFKLTMFLAEIKSKKALRKGNF